jgi:TolB-like protein
LEELRLGSRTLQPRRQLLAEGARVPIGKRALEILSVLAEAKGEIVTKDELLAAIWPGVTVEENALQVHIAALRKALGAEAPRLKTIRGIGYQLHIDDIDPGQEGPPAHEDPALHPSPAANPSIVVLPFANMSGEPEQEYFADGITEDIITDLSKVSALMVVARNTAFSCKGKELDVAEIARRFSITHVLEGSVRRVGDRVRVTAQLIDGATGGHVWAERYDRHLHDIFGIQDELSEAIVAALRVRLLPTERSAIADRYTRNAEAYDYYLRARALRATMDLAQIPISLDAYRKAIELDPDFSLAWAGLASSLIQNLSHFPKDKGLSLKEADMALERAIALAPDSLDVVAARARRACFDRDWITAAECIDRFRAADGDSWSMYSHLLLILGKPYDAAVQQEKVRRADPLSIGGAWALQFHLACAGRFAEAEAEYRRSTVLPGGFRPMRWEAIRRKTALGQLEAAKAEFVSEFNQPSEFLLFAPRLIKAFEGNGDASEVLRAALADPQAQDELSFVSVADCAVMIGDRDLAFDAMHAAFVTARGVMVMELWHPIFAPLRSDARFKQLLIDLGLVEYWKRTGDWGDFVRPLSDGDFEVLAA